MKTASFFKGLGYLVVLNLLVKPVWIFGIDRQIQNVVGHQTYGAYFALLNLSIVFGFLMDAGLTNMMNQKLASGKPVNVHQLLRLKILMSLLYAVLVVAIDATSGQTHLQLLLPVIAIQVFTSMFVLLRNIITAHQLFKIDAWLSVLDKSLMILFCAPLLYGKTAFSNILLYLYIQLACTCIAVVVAWWVIVKKPLLVNSTAEENTKGILKSLSPFAIIILLMSAHNRMDAFLLERLRVDGAYQAGIYAAAYRLLDAANVMGYLFAAFLVPFIAKNIAQKQLVQNAILAIRHILMISCLGAAVFIIAFARQASGLLYHSNENNLITVLQLCIAVLPAYMMVHIYGSVLTATASLKRFIYILIISVAINVLLNLLLIPGCGAAGCCVAALCSQYVCAVLLYLRASQSAEINYDVPSLLLYIAFAFVLWLLFFAGHYWQVQPAVQFVIAVVLLLLLVAFNIGRIKKYFVLLR